MSCATIQNITTGISSIIASAKPSLNLPTSSWADLVSKANASNVTSAHAIRVTYPIQIEYVVYSDGSFTLSKIIESESQLQEVCGEHAAGYVGQNYFTIHENSQAAFCNIAQAIKQVDLTQKAVGAIACTSTCNCGPTVLVTSDEACTKVWNYNYTEDGSEIIGYDLCTSKIPLLIPANQVQSSSQVFVSTRLIPNPTLFPKFAAVWFPGASDQRIPNDPSGGCIFADNETLTYDASSVCKSEEEKLPNNIRRWKEIYSYIYSAVITMQGAVSFGCFKNSGEKAFQHTPIRNDILAAKSGLKNFQLYASVDDINTISPPTDCTSTTLEFSAPVVYAENFHTNENEFNSYIKSIQNLVSDVSSFQSSIDMLPYAKVLISEGKVESLVFLYGSSDSLTIDTDNYSNFESSLASCGTYMSCVIDWFNKYATLLPGTTCTVYYRGGEGGWSWSGTLKVTAYDQLPEGIPIVGQDCNGGDGRPLIQPNISDKHPYASYEDLNMCCVEGCSDQGSFTPISSAYVLLPKLTQFDAVELLESYNSCTNYFLLNASDSIGSISQFSYTTAEEQDYSSLGSSWSGSFILGYSFDNIGDFDSALHCGTFCETCCREHYGEGPDYDTCRLQCQAGQSYPGCTCDAAQKAEDAKNAAQNCHDNPGCTYRCIWESGTLSPDGQTVKQDFEEYQGNCDIKVYQIGANCNG